MLDRYLYINKVHENFQVHGVTGLLGPRQCGKTTLAKQYRERFEKNNAHHFDLENPLHLSQLETPQLTLEPLEGLVVIDEIQLRPELFPYLRVLADEKPETRYLILGSASRDLIKQSSESLAGRIGYIELTPFQLRECGPDQWRSLWFRGGFPKSFLAPTENASLHWRKSYVQTFLERDLSWLGFHISPQNMRRLWMMLAHYHGNILNYSELSRSLGVSDMTIRRYIEILEATFMIRVLKPWFENIKKRQVKSPKIYIRDSGLLHALLDIPADQLTLHPKIGASWEGFALEEVIRLHEIESDNCFFWNIQGNLELDLLILKEGKRFGYEFKYTDTPKLTESMKKSLEILQLEKLTLIVPLNTRFQLAEKIEVVGLNGFNN